MFEKCFFRPNAITDPPDRPCRARLALKIRDDPEVLKTPHAYLRGWRLISRLQPRDSHLKAKAWRLWNNPLKHPTSHPIVCSNLKKPFQILSRKSRLPGSLCRRLLKAREPNDMLMASRKRVRQRARWIRRALRRLHENDWMRV